MLLYSTMKELVDGFCSVKDESLLHEALARATRLLGFNEFAMGHHVDLTCPPENAIRLSTYNENWVSHMLDRGYFFEDPIHLASTKTGVGFFWEDVPSLISLTARHRQILDEANRFGLASGITVPAHLPGEYRGTCSFAAQSTDGLHQNALEIAQLCGNFAFEAARRIMRRKRKFEPADLPQLTLRQQEALVLMGRGKTDREIGAIMGISKTTAHGHVEGVRRLYGNAQRVYLIVRALFDGQISFTDLLRR